MTSGAMPSAYRCRHERAGFRSCTDNPLWARKVPLDLEDAATRTTAYVYGNILVLAALVTQVSDGRRIRPGRSGS